MTWFASGPASVALDVGVADWAASLDALPVATLGVDRAGRIVAVNPAAAQLLGCAREVILGTPLESLVPVADRARLERHRAAVASEGAPRWMAASPEVTLLRPGGDARYVKVGLSAITLREGDFVVATVIDQSARHELQRRTQQVLETSPAVVCVWQQRPDGSVCMPFTSPSVEALYGVTREELARSAEVVLQRVHPEDRPRVLESIAASARDMSPWRCTYRVQVPDQPTRWVEGHSMPTRDADGTISWVGTVMDVTERHRAEARRRCPRLRVLLTSGYTDDRLSPHGDAPTDAAFLPKPFTQALLLRKVREVLDAH